MDTWGLTGRRSCLQEKDARKYKEGRSALLEAIHSRLPAGAPLNTPPKRASVPQCCVLTTVSKLVIRPKEVHCSCVAWSRRRGLRT